MNPTLSANPELACDTCGQFGAYAFEDEHLCLECYQERGSSCAGSRAPDPAGSGEAHDTPSC